MDRRQFCRYTATGLIASHPLIAGCGDSMPDATQADTAIPAVSLGGNDIELDKAAVQELGKSLSGNVLLSGHPKYDTVRSIWNGMHDKNPALIARCENAEDVSRAVTFAADRDLLLAVHGGGHSWPGKSVCEGGMMLDLSRMNAVDVDPDRQLALAGGGALLHDLDTATREHELITTAGVVSHTGVGGYTLGGGFGRLNRKFGLTIDNLHAATLVTADGQIRHVSADEEPDLFWAIRGGGGNFGVATQFEYRLHTFPLERYLGLVMWPIEQAPDVLAVYEDWQRGLSNDAYAAPVMLTTPDNQQMLVLEFLYAGDPAEGEKTIAPMLKAGKPVNSTLAVQDYMGMQTREDETFHIGIRSYAKSGMVPEITPGLLQAMVESFRGDPRYFMFTHTAGGAVNEVDELATAFPHRNAATMIVIGGAWEDPADDEQAIADLRDWYHSLEPHMGGYYDNINFDPEQVPGNYGPAYERLTRIKGQYDPGNLFRMNTNIEPVV